MHRACLTITGLLLACLSTVCAAQNPLDEVAEALEKRQMQRLAAQQQRHGVHIAAFNSDGCSGGMSHSWKLLAESLPPFARYIGDAPPWEHCCLEHDRAYWQGETDQGFEKRLESDAQLRACVRLRKDWRLRANLSLVGANSWSRLVQNSPRSLSKRSITLEKCSRRTLLKMF